MVSNEQCGLIAIMDSCYCSIASFRVINFVYHLVYNLWLCVCGKNGHCDDGGEHAGVADAVGEHDDELTEELALVDCAV